MHSLGFRQGERTLEDVKTRLHGHGFLRRHFQKLNAETILGDMDDPALKFDGLVLVGQPHDQNNLVAGIEPERVVGLKKEAAKAEIFHSLQPFFAFYHHIEMEIYPCILSIVARHAFPLIDEHPGLIFARQLLPDMHERLIINPW
jgi:hypothetical protein